MVDAGVVEPQALQVGDPVRVVFQVDVPDGGSYPSLRWTVRKLDGSPLVTAGYLADPAGEKGVFLAFPVEKTLICRVRATVSGGTQFGEATLVIHPPDRSGGKGEEAGEAIQLARMGLCGAA